MTSAASNGHTDNPTDLFLLRHEMSFASFLVASVGLASAFEPGRGGTGPQQTQPHERRARQAARTAGAMVLAGLLAVRPLPSQGIVPLLAETPAGITAGSLQGFESLEQKRQFEREQAEIERQNNLPVSRKEFNARFDEIDARFDRLEMRFDEFDMRFDEFDMRLNQQTVVLVLVHVALKFYDIKVEAGKAKQAELQRQAETEWLPPWLR